LSDERNWFGILIQNNNTMCFLFDHDFNGTVLKIGKKKKKVNEQKKK